MPRFSRFKSRGEIHENFISASSCALYIYVATLLWGSVRMKFTLPKLGLGSPPGLPKLQSSIARVKTPRIEVFFISLESYQNLNVENGLAWAIWTSIAQVMAKRRVGNWPDPGACRSSEIHRWKALKENYKFASDLIPIGGLSKELWPHKIPGVQTGIVSGLFLRSPGTKKSFGCECRGEAQN
jgi:hypothetical protein